MARTQARRRLRALQAQLGTEPASSGGPPRRRPLSPRRAGPLNFTLADYSALPQPTTDVDTLKTDVRRHAAQCVAAATAAAATDVTGHDDTVRLRFGMTADAHLLGRTAPENESVLRSFVETMKTWRPDLVVEMGDFGCQISNDPITTTSMHDGQLEALHHHVSVLAEVPCPRLHVLGNHDVGWVRGGDEHITAADLIGGTAGQDHFGEDITKQEFLEATASPGRYYSFEANGFLMIVLDANNQPDSEAPTPGHDGIEGAYYVDAGQRRWLQALLSAHRSKPKLVFCHQELHHTPVGGSGEGGDVPFPAVGKEGSYVDNGWQIRQLLAADQKVLACFHGHKHRSRWAMYGGVHYVTLAGTHWQQSFALVTVSGEELLIEGAGGQRSCCLPITS
jgi:hypothetical protein